jgi:protein involved in ribonucleotide reduction
MLIVYLSLTGNVKRFVSHLDMQSIEIKASDYQKKVKDKFIIIVPTYDDEITDIASQFIDYGNNVDYLIGFVGSGNMNFDNNYVFNAKDLSKKYNKPLIYNFEYSGTDTDLINFKREVANIEIT